MPRHVMEVPLLEALCLQISPQQGRVILSSWGDGGRASKIGTAINQADPVPPVLG